MLKHYAFGALALILGTRAAAQPAFTDGSAALPHEASSGNCMAVTDMDGDGRDDIVQLDMSTDITILYQNADHSFTAFDYGTVSGGEQWGWAIADVDNDGHKDIVSGGHYDGSHFVRISSRGVYTLTDLDGPEIYTQCMSMADVNNDGRVDVLACHDDGPPNLWFTSAGGVPVNNNAYIDWTTACTGQSGDMSGNYGSTFTDFDNDGDIDLFISHCRQGVSDPDDCRRWNRLFVNDGTDHYADLAADYNMDSHEQTWTSDFGDYDNDGDLDVVSTNHNTSITLYENDGTGHYTQVTAGSGLSGTQGFMLQGLFRDLDNDGWLDILIAGGQGVAAYFRGHGDGKFTKYGNLFPDMHGFAFGDLDQDGFEDVYANYGENYVDGDPANPDRLWLNTPNGNHWFNMNLEGVMSNRDAVGARVTITGPWGTQIREVHAGESYGMVNSFTCHFGLGKHTLINTVTIHWPSGEVDTFENVHADQTMTVVEGGCSSPNVHISSTALALCTGGGPVTLTADAGFTYAWSTSATGQSISVSQPGSYSVIISDGSACSTQAGIFLPLDPDETPVITASGPTTFCEFDAVILTASEASNYAWTGGSQEQSITVQTSGTYTVTVNGACDQFTSDPVILTMLDAPDAPASNDVSIPSPGTADLTAAGDSIVWYNAATAGAVVGTGSPWTTPFLTDNTTYWCADVLQYGGDIANGGRTDKSTVGGYLDNANNYLLFTAYEDLVINSVKVYANGNGERTFIVMDQASGDLLAEATIEVPTGESRVQLGFNVPAGGPYSLRIGGGNPQLWRDQIGSNPAYPYALGTLGAITSSSVNSNPTAYYYFFYDWEVMSPASYCAGPRTAVNVHVGPVGVGEVAAENGLHVFPNPADDRLTIAFDGLSGPMDVDLLDVAGRSVLGRRVQAGSADAVLDISRIAPGGYTLRARHAQGLTVTRVVVR